MTIDPIIEKAVETWSEQGRTEDQIWAVKNFLTGAGGIAIASYGSEQRKLGGDEKIAEVVAKLLKAVEGKSFVAFPEHEWTETELQHNKDIRELTNAILALKSPSPTATKEPKACKCHCHFEELHKGEGFRCRCIKHCEHCHPENFSPKSKDEINHPEE